MKHSYSIIYVFLLVILAGLVSCSKPMAPVYYNFVNFKVDSIRNNDAVVSADLKYFNPNRYNLKLKEGAVDVYLNQKFAGHTTLDSMIVIPKLDTFYLPVSMHVNLKVILSNALSILLNNEIDIKLQGNAKVGRGGLFMNIPILYEGKQAIPLYNQLER